MGAMMWIQVMDVAGVVLGFGLMLAMLLHLGKASAERNQE
jgi:hypothetical protein